MRLCVLVSLSVCFMFVFSLGRELSHCSMFIFLFPLFISFNEVKQEQEQERQVKCTIEHFMNIVSSCEPYST